jgi:hypothetical protein
LYLRLSPTKKMTLIPYARDAETLKIPRCFCKFIFNFSRASNRFNRFVVSNAKEVKEGNGNKLVNKGSMVLRL